MLKSLIICLAALLFLNAPASAFKIGQPQKAPDGFSADIINDPDNYKLYNSRGKEYLTRKQYMKALNDFKQAIAISPKYADPYNNIGMVYVQLKRYDFALENFSKAIELDPKFFSAYKNRALFYKMRDMPDKACLDLKEACKLGDCNDLKTELDLNCK